MGAAEPQHGIACVGHAPIQMVVVVVGAQCLGFISRIEQLVALVAVVLVGVCARFEYKGFGGIGTGFETFGIAVGKVVPQLALQDHAVAVLGQHGPQVAVGYIGCVGRLLAGGNGIVAFVVHADLTQGRKMQVGNGIGLFRQHIHFRKQYFVHSVIGIPMFQVRGVSTAGRVQVLISGGAGVAQLPVYAVFPFVVFHYAQSGSFGLVRCGIVSAVLVAQVQVVHGSEVVASVACAVILQFPGVAAAGSEVG